MAKRRPCYLWFISFSSSWYQEVWEIQWKVLEIPFKNNFVSNINNPAFQSFGLSQDSAKAYFSFPYLPLAKAARNAELGESDGKEEHGTWERVCLHTLPRTSAPSDSWTLLVGWSIIPILPGQGVSPGYRTFSAKTRKVLSKLWWFGCPILVLPLFFLHKLIFSVLSISRKISVPSLRTTCNSWHTFRGLYEKQVSFSNRLVPSMCPLTVCAERGSETEYILGNSKSH